MLKESMHEHCIWGTCETETSVWFAKLRDDGLGDSGQCYEVLDGKIKASSCSKATWIFASLMLAKDWELFTHTDYCMKTARDSWCSSMGITLPDISTAILLWKESLSYWYKESLYLFPGVHGRDCASINERNKNGKPNSLSHVLILVSKLG